MLKKTIISFFILLTIVIGSLQFPELFIKKQCTYKSFEIYSNQEILLNEDVQNILDSSWSHLQKSAFYDKDQVLQLYFIRGSFYEKALRMFGRKNMAFSKFDKHIYSAHPLFKDGILKRNNNDYEWLNLVQIITHEGIHSQMYPDYSTLGFMNTPAWINEGYCEYISFIPIRVKQDYQLAKLALQLETNKDIWVKTPYGSMTPRFYAHSRLLIEYLIDIKGMTIKEIIQDESLNPETLYKEIKTYFKEK